MILHSVFDLPTSTNPRMVLTPFARGFLRDIFSYICIMYSCGMIPCLGLGSSSIPNTFSICRVVSSLAKWSRFLTRLNGPCNFAYFGPVDVCKRRASSDLIRATNKIVLKTLHAKRVRDMAKILNKLSILMYSHKQCPCKDPLSVTSRVYSTLKR